MDEIYRTSVRGHTLVYKKKHNYSNSIQGQFILSFDESIRKVLNYNKLYCGI